MNATRRPLKFESANGSISYTWPRYQMEYDASQPLEGASVALTGANYDFDLLGDGVQLKRNGLHTLRFMAVGDPASIEAEIDAMKGKLFDAGRGKFFLEDSDGAQRWCWARVQAMPDLRLGTADRQRVPVILSWSQFSDFYDVEDEYDGAVFTLDADPDTVEVTNPGNASVYNAVITLKGPFSAPVITNTTTGYVLRSTTEGAASTDWLRFDAGANTVKFSSDDGATWFNDFTNFVRADGQVALWVHAAGTNTVVIEGANGAEVDFDLAGAWH